MQIHKQVIDFDGDVIYLPENSYLDIQMQGDNLCLWYLNKVGEIFIKWEIFVIGTGQEFDSRGLEYLKTVQDGEYVWHIYKRGM